MTTVAVTTSAQMRIGHATVWDRLLHRLLPTVEAATPATISGSYSGMCETIPTNVPAGSWVPIYEFGEDSQQNCGTFFSPTVPTGDHAIGSGTLSTLVVYGFGTNTTDASGKVMIFVNGQPTALTCTLGTSARCEDTVDTVPVADNDIIGAGFQAASTTETWQDVKVILLKQ